MHNINKGLGITSAEVTDHLDFFLTGEDRLNQGDDFMRQEDTTDYASTGWCIEADEDG